MNLTRSKKKDLLYVAVAAFFFLTACVLQTVDDYISDWSVKKNDCVIDAIYFLRSPRVLDGVRDQPHFRQKHLLGDYRGDSADGGDPFCQTSQISRILRRNRYSVFMVFLLYSTMHCTRGFASNDTRYGAQRRKTACKRMVSAVSACGGADSIGFYERSSRASIFFCRRSGVFQQNIQMGMGLLFNTVVDGWIVSFYRRIALRKVSHFVVSEKGVDTSRTLCYLFYIVCFKRSV